MTLDEKQSGDSWLAMLAFAGGGYGFAAKLTVKRSRTPIDTGYRMFFMAYFARGLADNGAQVKLEDLFVPSFASYIATAFERGGTDTDVGKRLGGKVIQVGGLLGVQRVIQKSVREALANGDRTNPLMQLLAKHDCYSWKPGGPLYLVGLQQDGIVPFSNTIIAARAMRGPRVRYHAITTRRMDHDQATAPSLGLVRAFFDGGFAAVPSDPLPKLKQQGAEKDPGAVSAR